MDDTPIAFEGDEEDDEFGQVIYQALMNAAEDGETTEMVLEMYSADGQHCRKVKVTIEPDGDEAQVN